MPGVPGATLADGALNPQAAVTHILAIRHGETDWNVDSRIQGQIDIPLNAHGERQALALGQRLAQVDATGVPLAAVYCSDLQRAYATARSVSQHSGAALHRHAGLRERHFGVFQGHSYTEIAERWPEASALWRRRDPSFSPAGGESLLVFYERSVRTVLQLAQQHPGQTIAVVTHGGVLDCLYRAATHLPLEAPRSWVLANAGINRLLHSQGQLSLVGWADTAHLDAHSLDETEKAGA